MTTEQSLKNLFSRRAWHKNSGINESTARVFKKRFFEKRLEIETQIKILESCGYKIIQEMQWEEKVDNEKMKSYLTHNLKNASAFWAFDPLSIGEVSDEILIEKVLLHLDIDDVNLLFRLFHKKDIMKIWKEKILPQEPMNHQLNRLFLYFNIKDPDRYIRNYLNRKHTSFNERISKANCRLAFN
jgi:hypothetical protein